MYSNISHPLQYAHIQKQYASIYIHSSFLSLSPFPNCPLIFLWVSKIKKKKKTINIINHLINFYLQQIFFKIWINLHPTLSVWTKCVGWKICVNTIIAMITPVLVKFYRKKKKSSDMLNGIVNEWRALTMVLCVFHHQMIAVPLLGSIVNIIANKLTTIASSQTAIEFILVRVMFKCIRISIEKTQQFIRKGKLLLSLKRKVPKY